MAIAPEWLCKEPRSSPRWRRSDTSQERRCIRYGRWSEVSLPPFRLGCLLEQVEQQILRKGKWAVSQTITNWPNQKHFRALLPARMLEVKKRRPWTAYQKVSGDGNSPDYPIHPQNRKYCHPIIHSPRTSNSRKSDYNGYQRQGKINPIPSPFVKWSMIWEESETHLQKERTTDYNLQLIYTLLVKCKQMILR